MLEKKKNREKFNLRIRIRIGPKTQAAVLVVGSAAALKHLLMV